MNRFKSYLLFLLCLSMLSSFTPSKAEFVFSDDRYQYDFTTENIDLIIEEYELYDGWYWTTQADIQQNFHGHPECPGWTSTVDKHGKKHYAKGWYGCRWPIDHVRKAAPDQGGVAECFAFAQFIGYLLSGIKNPQKNWDFYYSLDDSGGLHVGDIIRVEYTKNRKDYQHSAVVYAVNGDEVLFIQVSGGNYNMISVGKGFSDGNYNNLTTIDELINLPGIIKISRFNRKKESVPAF